MAKGEGHRNNCLVSFKRIRKELITKGKEKKMRKIIWWSLFVFIVVVAMAAGYLWGGKMGVQKAHSQLLQEVEQYYDGASKRAAEVSFKLARPYLTEEKISRYQQCFDYLADPNLSIDSYTLIIYEIVSFEFKNWTARTSKEGIGFEQYCKIQRLVLTNQSYQIINDIYYSFKEISDISQKLGSDEVRSASRKEIEEVRLDFETAKNNLEVLLTAATLETQ